MPRLTSLTAHDLTLRRGERTLLEGLSFGVRQGGALAVVGANGSGKTSLLRAVAGLLAPARGRIDFMAGATRIDADEAIRRACHLTGHQNGFTGDQSARAELLFSAAWAGGTTAAALSASAGLGLTALLDLPTRKLSEGQRRRLVLARLLAAPRPLWLLDEPLAPLDAAGRAFVGQAMRRHLEDGGLIIAAVHDPLPVPCETLVIG